MSHARDCRFKVDEFELYRAAREFRKKVYQLIKQLPSDEKYCLDKQMRKAAISVSNNVAEGHGRWHHQENIRFCRIARGSIDEIQDDLNMCEDEKYGDHSLVMELKVEGYALIARINSYIAYLRRSQQSEENDREVST